LADLKFSLQALRDLEEIDLYSEARWSLAQADRYLDQVQSHCNLLASNPLLGRIFHRRRPGVLRSEVGSHVIFYRQTARGILVLRILHQRMMPENHLSEETP
jgi:toxin ParE1/3/4